MQTRKIALLLTCLFFTSLAFGQGISQQYAGLIKQAENLFAEENYQASGEAYSDAFKSNGWLGAVPDRYNAARAWALARNPDSAFYQLDRIALKGLYFNYDHLEKDVSLKLLHADKRWKPLIAVVKQHKEKLYPKMDLTLAEQLNSVYASDQKYRLQIDEVAAKHGWDSKELKNLWAEIKIADSLNLIKVKKVLDTHGWLGEQVVGSTGNHALFLVIQHADTKTQEKYLPTLQEAVKKGNAKGSQLALLTDRIAVFNGRKQIYGSQIRQDPDTHTYTIFPLGDPDRVDERRTKVGLGPLAEYLKQWKINWDVEAYKKARG